MLHFSVLIGSLSLGDNIMWAASWTRCKCDYSSSLCFEIHSPTNSLFWVDKRRCRQISIFRGDNNVLENDWVQYMIISLLKTRAICCKHACSIADSHKWYCFLGTNERDISASWSGSERYPYIREIFAGLLLKHIEKVERP